jgi:4-aminobutyrate--pyruvate transaminase
MALSMISILSPEPMRLETFKIHEQCDILGHVRRTAPDLQTRLRGIGETPAARLGQGQGPAWRIGVGPGHRENSDLVGGAAAHAGQRAQAHGVIAHCIGDNINLCSPLILTETDIVNLMAG